MNFNPLQGVGLWVDNDANKNLIDAETDNRPTINPIVAFFIGVIAVFGCLVVIALLML